MTKKIKIKNNRRLNLSSVLSIPDENGKYSAIILLHGFTGYKDEKHIVDLAKDLVENDFVSIRFDSSGFGESDGNTEHDYRVSNYVDDIESIYEFLRKQNCVDNTKIGVWGQSMGGMLSIIFASKHPEIKAVCAVSVPTQITRTDALKGWLKEWKEKGFFDKRSSKYGQVRIPYAFVEDAQNWSAEESVKNIHVPLLIILGCNKKMKNFDAVFDKAKQKEIPILIYTFGDNEALTQGHWRKLKTYPYYSVCNSPLRLVSDVFALISTFPNKK